MFVRRKVNAYKLESLMSEKILYLTNIEVPYRVHFFNELARCCDLTVMYERKDSGSRNAKWASSAEMKYNVEYLDGCVCGDETAFSINIIKLLKKDWNLVVVGCYNSRVQMLAMIYMRLNHIPFIINLDGETFIGRDFKSFLKKSVLKLGDAYLTAGVVSSISLRKQVGKNKLIFPYYFSSLSDADLRMHANNCSVRENYVLVVGQYLNVKGLDVAMKVAMMDKTIHYKFVGMGKRTNVFLHDIGKCPDNVEIISFLQKADLEEEYKKCAMLLLPTRQECWGLVVNEAASFGTPIVSTWGSGAAVEFISEKYPEFLAVPGDALSLYKCICKCLQSDTRQYSEYLKTVSRQYSMEKMVKAHVQAFNEVASQISY